jgi:peroxiredoxin
MKSMIQRLVLVAAVATLSVHAAIPKLCYDTVDGTQFCTTDNTGKVQVFVFNAGWCPPCNQEMDELSAGYPEFAGKEVVIASLSGEGFSHGTQPDQAFLKAWKKKHNIPFTVAGKYKDFGSSLGATGTIPFSVIVDKTGNVVKKGNISAGSIYNTVRQLLKQ